MLDWIVQNLGTIIVATVLVAMLALIIIFRIRAKKKGHSGCGCGCENCANYGVCRSKTKEKQ